MICSFLKRLFKKPSKNHTSNRGSSVPAITRYKQKLLESPTSWGEERCPAVPNLSGGASISAQPQDTLADRSFLSSFLSTHLKEVKLPFNNLQFFRIFCQ